MELRTDAHCHCAFRIGPTNYISGYRLYAASLAGNALAPLREGGQGAVLTKADNLNCILLTPLKVYINIS